jgi:hypothetical protein
MAANFRTFGQQNRPTKTAKERNQSMKLMQKALASARVVSLVVLCLCSSRARAAIDMIVTSVSMNAASPATGQHVIFSATIKNQGTTATPAGVKNGVVFSIDGATATWSDNNTSSIPAGGSVTVTANGGPAGLAYWTATAGSHSLDAWVNDAQRYAESSFSNNHLVTNITVASGAADVIVTALSMNPATPVNGQTVTFSATIKNQGTAATPGGSIRNGVVFSVDGTAATWSDNNFTSIAPGASVTVTANGGPTGGSTWTATTGSHNIDAWVNDALVYPESNTGNNHLVTPITVAAGMADMIVVSSSMTPANPLAGQAVTFSATIKNQGTLATPAGVKNGVVFSIDGVTTTWSDNNTSSIPPGGSVTVTANSGPSGSATWTATTGSHNLDSWVNDAQRYPESNLNNNHLITPFTIGSIDMIVTAISMSPASPTAGQAVTFSATIKNQGTAPTPGGTTRNGVVFSVDGVTATWSDNNFAAIAPGASVTVTANSGPSGSATWTAVSGSHNVDAWVNDALVYPESNTSNNHLVTPITVGGGTPGPYGQNGSLYSLTFSDEFNGTSLDTTKWTDHQWYDSSDPNINYAVENGLLKIWPVSPFVNRTLTTDGKFSQTYGYYEANMKLNVGKGCWPAFWLYAHPVDARPEIDIMEAYPGGGPSSGWGDSNLHPVNFGLTLHRANADYSFHQVPYQHTYTEFKPPIDLSAAFHIYGVKWTSTSITFYFDGQQLGPTYSYSDSYYNRPMYVLFDLWFGSASGTPDGTTPTGKPNSFQVDYVRVWQIN